MSKQQSFITVLNQQSELRNMLLTSEHRIHKLNTRDEDANPIRTALEYELQIAFQGLQQHIQKEGGVYESISPLSDTAFSEATTSLESTSAKETLKTTLVLLHTLLQLPHSEKVRYIKKDGFSLLPLLKALQAEENALLSRIQSLQHKKLLTTLLGVIILVLWYFFVWLFYKSSVKRPLRKLHKSKLRLAIADDQTDLQILSPTASYPYIRVLLNLSTETGL